MAITEMDELRKSQTFLSPPRSPFLDQPSGKCLSFLAGLCTVDSIHWAAGSAGTRAVVSLAHRYIPSTPAARSWAGAGRCKRTGARLGTQIPGALLARRSPWRPRSSRAGSGRPAPSSRAQDEACLLWASCGVENRLTPLQALADSPPPVPRDPPPPSWAARRTPSLLTGAQL